MQVIDVQFCWIDPDSCRDLSLPAYATKLAAGMDAAAATVEDTVLHPGEIKLFSTGFAVAQKILHTSGTFWMVFKTLMGNISFINMMKQ